MAVRCVVAIPDFAAVELVASGGRAVKREAVAGHGGCRCGVLGFAVVVASVGGGLDGAGVKRGLDPGGCEGVCHGGIGGEKVGHVGFLSF